MVQAKFEVQDLFAKGRGSKILPSIKDSTSGHIFIEDSI
jgi:hypothetical protein